MKTKLATIGLIILLLTTSIGLAAEVEKKVADVKQSVSPTESTQDKNELAKLAVKAIMTGEEINWQVISGGGTIEGESSNYKLSSTVGQTAVGEGTGGDKVLNHGFLQTFEAGASGCATAGDANHDGSTNVGDAVYLIAHVFKGGPAPQELNEGDANFDCAVNVGDAVFLIAHVFKGGPPAQCGCVE
ncbi:MAG: dockerin type I domain-containing protein [candidate division Zixibacteria bacterium]